MCAPCHICIVLDKKQLNIQAIKKMPMLLTLIVTSLQPLQMSTFRFGKASSMLWYSTTARKAFYQQPQSHRPPVNTAAMLQYTISVIVKLQTEIVSQINARYWIQTKGHGNL